MKLSTTSSANSSDMVYVNSVMEVQQQLGLIVESGGNEKVLTTFGSTQIHCIVRYCALLTILNLSISVLGYECDSILLTAKVFLLVDLFYVGITVNNFTV